MYLRPCRNCPHKDGCEIKAEKLSKLQGLGLTLVNFRCDKRLSALQPGQRVKFDFEVFEEVEDHFTGGYQTVSWEIECTGTVMRPRRNRVLVFVDYNDGDVNPHRNPLPLHPNRVTPIEGIRELCPVCGQPKGTRPMDRGKNRYGMPLTYECNTCKEVKWADEPA